MLSVLRNRTYRHLLTAQVIALIGTGLATVALGLLAYDIAGARAGSVLGTALAIKMAAYVAIAPAIGAVSGRLPRRTLMVGADLIRAAVALTLPFVDQIWQVYVLIFALQAASAAFTPTFQAVVPEVLPEEGDYTRALSLSRLAYDLESLFSPALAAALLAFMSYNWLFLGTTAGFVASAALVVSAVLPKSSPAASRGEGREGREGGQSGEDREPGERPKDTRTTGATGLFLTTPSLRALLSLNLAVAAAGAVVTVNTVVYVRDHLGRATSDVALALGAYGAGSMIVALLLPRLLDAMEDRTVMLRGAFLLTAVFGALGAITAAGAGGWRWPALLAAWAAFGAACSMVLTPTGRLIRRAVPSEERASAFAAQFSLSHACWLLTYPLAGWLGATAGLQAAVIALGAIAFTASVLAVRLWSPGERGSRPHAHAAPTVGHPHLTDADRAPDGRRHHHPVADPAHAHGPMGASRTRS
ncbi:MFS transporter [Streptomyces sp. NPDC054932]